MRHCCSNHLDFVKKKQKEAEEQICPSPQEEYG